MFTSRRPPVASLLTQDTMVAVLASLYHGTDSPVRIVNKKTPDFQKGQGNVDIALSWLLTGLGFARNVVDLLPLLHFMVCFPTFIIYKFIIYFRGGGGASVHVNLR